MRIFFFPLFEEVSEQLAHLRSLGIGALILEGVFHKGMSISNLTDAPTQIQLLLMESNKASEFKQEFCLSVCVWINAVWFFCPADLKVVMDLCEADLLELYAAAGHSDMPSNHSTPVQVKHVLSSHKLGLAAIIF